MTSKNIIDFCYKDIVKIKTDYKINPDSCYSFNNFEKEYIIETYLILQKKNKLVYKKYHTFKYKNLASMSEKIDILEKAGYLSYYNKENVNLPIEEYQYVKK